ncbi:MAG: T9SS type A sorting domain-containing protein [Bacteroidetes bacterium]|nr:T9SS type A sorting domain-containing protein [Bacteroidota bacterium]
MIKNILLLIAVVSSLNSFSQDFQWAGSEPYASYVTWTSHITNDNSGNTFISSQHQNGVLIVKYNVAGAKVWEQNWLGYGNINSLGTDHSGNLYAGIMIAGLTINGTQYLESNGGGYLLLKIDPNGNVIWIKQVHASMFVSDKTDSRDNIVVSGGYFGTVHFDANTTVSLPAGSSSSHYMAKFDVNGMCKWVITEDGPQWSAIKAANDYLYACDYFYGHITLGKGSKQVTLNESNGMGYIAKYDSVGELLWVKQGNYYDIAPDEKGNLYTFEGDMNGGYHSYLKKFNSEGDSLWTRTHLYYSDIYKFAMDYGNDGIFFTGSFRGKLILDDTTINQSGNYRLFAGKIDTEGKVRWITTTDGSGAVGAKDISVKGNDIYITGDISGTSDFGSNATTQTNGGIFLTKISDQNITTVKATPLVASTFDVFPNPSGSVFNVSYTGSLPEITIHIKNQLGQVVLSKKYSVQSELKESFDLRSQPKGIYFIELVSDKSREVRKMVLQ